MSAKNMYMGGKSKKLKEKLANIEKNISCLQKIVECPVCLDMIRIPFKTCSRGHGICSSCCEKLKECPTCEGEFTAENPVCLKNILEALPRLCRYSIKGCEEIFEPRIAHEEFCRYRPIVCQSGDCKVKVPLIKLIDHYGEKHPENNICNEMFAPMTFNDFDPKLNYESSRLVTICNNIFYLSLVNDIGKRHLRISFQAYPMDKLERDHFAIVKFESGDFVLTWTIKAIVSSSCEIEEGKNEEEDENCMRIPQALLHKFVDEDKDLGLCFFFYEEEK